MRDKLRVGIRGRLFSAFGVVTFAMIASSAMAWVLFTRLGDTVDEVVGRNVSAVTFAAQLAEYGGGIIGLAPALAAAQDNVDRERVWTDLSERLHNMGQLLDSNSEDSDIGAVVEDFRNDVNALQGNLQTLNTVVSRRLFRSSQKRELGERLRWASSDFLNEVEPMIDDTRFNISLALSRDGENKAYLKEELVRERALFMIHADGSLMAELIGRAANIPDEDTLRGTELYFQEISDQINKNYLTIKAVPGALSLLQSIQDIQAFAKGQSSLFELRASELDDVNKEQALLAKNQTLLSHMDQLISKQVAAETSDALRAVERSRLSINKGRAWLTLAVFIGVVVAVPVVWLYVDHGLVGRLRTLDTSMRVIADGDLKAEVPVRGRDEIGDMATSLRTFRDTLSETQAELVQAAKMAALGQLTAGISHEINQPLSAIRHYSRNTGLLIDKGRDAEAKDNLQKITKLVARANRITESLRAVSRNAKHDLRPTDMVVVVDEVLALLARRLGENDIQTEVQIDEACRQVIAGQVRLEQVILNLVTNAIDAMKDAPVRRLTITAEQGGEWADLFIRDTGCGIPDTIIKRIFDPFFTTKDVGEGLGLGLSISYNLVKGFGGSMRAESVIGEGSVINIKLKRVS